jgi:hypothetical protein
MLERFDLMAESVLEWIEGRLGGMVFGCWESPLMRPGDSVLRALDITCPPITSLSSSASLGKASEFRRWGSVIPTRLRTRIRQSTHQHLTLSHRVRPGRTHTRKESRQPQRSRNPSGSSCRAASGEGTWISHSRRRLLKGDCHPLDRLHSDARDTWLPTTATTCKR